MSTEISTEKIPVASPYKKNSSISYAIVVLLRCMSSLSTAHNTSLSTIHIDTYVSYNTYCKYLGYRKISERLLEFVSLVGKQTS